ncbi:MAG: TetR/AcrR family transcriptional regulator, partial [Paracoccaceae bacterium]|nr:TetR/AcrR family transcriptional regulator [Paracoccaceae bacterium]
MPVRGRGRPKGFDVTGALESAMRVFWAQGYAAAPVDLLCRQMHMPRASLYHTYGDKERLFLAAVAHYVDTRIARIAALLETGQDLTQDLTGFFNGVIALATDDPATSGCLVACVLADAAGANPRLQAELSLRFEAIEQRLTDRLRLAQSRGDLAPGTD